MPIDPNISLQKQFAPRSVCFGCGPANQQGLGLQSFVTKPPAVSERAENPAILVAHFQPQPHHIAFEGIVNGGILSVLLDCHLNWTGAWQLMLAGGLDVPPCCVTAKYEVTFQSPTPVNSLLRIEAWVEEISNRKAIVGGRLGPVLADGSNPGNIREITATARGTFVAVKPGHPAYHRW